MQKELKNDDSLRQKAFKGALWKLLEKGGVQIIQFVIQIILARLLLPSEYGLVGLLTVFILVSDVFITQGLTTALIQKKNADEIDFSSVFFTNVLMGVALYIILFVISPLVASFYHEQQLVPLLRVLSLTVLIGSFGSVHNAVLTRDLAFKASFLRNLLSVFTQGIVGIYLAVRGFGAWALVFSKVFGVFVGTIVLMISVRWKPSVTYSFSRIRFLFSFSSKVLITNLLNTFFNNMHSLIIGRFFSSSDLGYYQRGQQTPQIVMTAIDGSFNEVLYPTLAIVQDNKNAFKSALRRSMKTSMFFVFPLMFGIMATADSMVRVLLTDVWLPSVPFVYLQCIICLFWPFSAFTHALNALGDSKTTLKINLISKILTVILIVLCVRYGLYAIMIGTIIASIISTVVLVLYIENRIGYTIWELIKDIGPIFFVSCIMFVIVYCIGIIDFNIYIKFTVQVMSGILFYCLLSIIFRIDSFNYILDVIYSIVKKN